MEKWIKLSQHKNSNRDLSDHTEWFYYDIVNIQVVACESALHILMVLCGSNVKFLEIWSEIQLFLDNDTKALLYDHLRISNEIVSRDGSGLGPRL